MTNVREGTLILHDREGNVYLIPGELLDQLRVPADRVAEVQEVLAGADVAGFAGGTASFDIEFCGTPWPRPFPWPRPITLNPRLLLPAKLGAAVIGQKS